MTIKKSAPKRLRKNLDTPDQDHLQAAGWSAIEKYLASIDVGIRNLETLFKQQSEQIERTIAIHKIMLKRLVRLEGITPQRQPPVMNPSMELSSSASRRSDRHAEESSPASAERGSTARGIQRQKYWMNYPPQA